ncbi:MAG: exosortase/archaeosortase family protein [Planctomycetota bacterium]
MASNEQAFAFDDESALGKPLDSAGEMTAWGIFALLTAALTFGYWNMFTFTASFWSDPLYSHGYLIPVIAGFLFYARRRQLVQVTDRERWIGLGIIIASLCVRLWASTYDINPIDRVTYITALLGITQLVGGWSMLKWAGPPLAFLIFMFPIPSVLQNSVLIWLQKLAAISSTWTLQLIGVPALRDGSRLMIDGLELEVADACSGLRMSTIFGAMSVALAMMMNRPWWDRVVILLSAIPVALFTNVIRITITALLYMAFPESEAVKHAVHDWAGLAMMPIAMGILWLELSLLHKITVPIDVEDDYAAFSAPHAANS